VSMRRRRPGAGAQDKYLGVKISSAKGVGAAFGRLQRMMTATLAAVRTGSLCFLSIAAWRHALVGVCALRFDSCCDVRKCYATM
jgi:hypothetical protein